MTGILAYIVTQQEQRRMALADIQTQRETAQQNASTYEAARREYVASLRTMRETIQAEIDRVQQQ